MESNKLTVDTVIKLSVQKRDMSIGVRPIKWRADIIRRYEIIAAKLVSVSITANK